jgi:hypothetical protein
VNGNPDALGRTDRHWKAVGDENRHTGGLVGSEGCVCFGEPGHPTLRETLGGADVYHVAAVHLPESGDGEILRHLVRGGPALLHDRALITVRRARPKCDDRCTCETNRT